VSISTFTRRAPTLELLLGGRINGHATFDEAIPNEISYFEDAVYNMDGTSFAWYAGDATGIDDDGNFRVFQCLPAGQYYYQAGNIGEGVKSQYFGGVTSMANATPITIPKGGFDAQPVDMHFTALDGGQVSGTVVDEEGNPLTGYIVLAYDEISDSFSSTTSGPDGEYTINGLNTPGDYTVVAFGEGMWFGTSGVDYAYFPSDAKEDAVPIYLTKTNSARSLVDVVIDGSVPPKAIFELWPWFDNMNVAAPAIDFDGVAEALLDGSVAIDEENIQVVPDTRHRSGANLTDWELDVEVNFNSIEDNTVGAYGFTGGSEAAGLGDIPAVNDRARVIGALDLAEGLNFVTVTGSESGDTVAVPIVYGSLAPTMLTTPSLSGNLKSGRKVTAESGVWVAGPEITRTTYQWMTCSSTSVEIGCKPIKGAKKLKLTVPASAKRKYLALKATATNGATSTVEIHSFGRVR
jgi:hypothetical protein